MEVLKECPFCGGEPWFKGSAADWKDDRRYVELSLICCVQMTETIGWMRARDMLVRERDKELRERLSLKWNTRYTKE